MILLSAYLIIWTDVELVIKLMFGGAGIANTFGALLYYPIEKIQLLKGRLAVYQAAYISWLSNMFISEAVIQDLHAGTSKLSVDDCIKLSESSTKTIKELLILINPKSDIDKLSKLYNAKTHKK